MEEQQPQYFDVTAPAPTPVPWWRTWKIALPIGSAVLIVLVVVFVANTLSIRGNVAVQEQRQALSRMDQRLTACNDERDPAACKERVQNDAAQNGAGDDACDGLQGDAYGSCVTLSARSSGEVSVCGALEGDERSACEDLVYASAADEEPDLETCKRIGDTDLQAACAVNVTAAAVASGDCASANVEEAVCDRGAALADAIGRGDAAACNALASSDDAYECTLGIASVDEDDDGLVVAEEFAAGTSDTDADTDGDGYPDKDELDNGHDPLH